jgi:hypothetical protein
MLAFTLPSLYSHILLNEKATEGEEQQEEEEDDEDMTQSGANERE